MDSNTFYNKILDSQMAFTFDSVLLRPGKAVIEPKDADISTNFSKSVLTISTFSPFIYLTH